MTRIKSFFSGVVAIALAPFANAQITEQSQTQLESMALTTLQTSESLYELATAAEVLALLKKSDASNTSQACKHISKLVLDDEDSLPSVLFRRATLFRDLKCNTLSGVGKDITALLNRLLEQNTVAKMDNDELYYAYRLMSDAGAFGVTVHNKQDIISKFTDRAENDWLTNFTPSKWTLKQKKLVSDSEGDSIERIDKINLDPSVLQVTEMLSSLLHEKKVSVKASEQLFVAFNTLFTHTVPETSAFFISKNVKDQATINLTYNAMRAFQKYQANVDTEDLFDTFDKRAVRDYYMNKVAGSSSLQQAATALRGLDELSAKDSLPIAKIVAGQVFQLGGSGSVTLQLLDVLGNAIGAGDQEMMQVLLEYADGKTIDATGFSSLDVSAGRVKVQLDQAKDLNKGTFKIRVKFGSKVSQQALTQESVRAASTLKLSDFSYELTKSIQPSSELKEASLMLNTYPDRVSSFEKDQGTDEMYLHFTASADVTDSKKNVLDHPDQVYLAFKKTDSKNDDQLQVNAQALWSKELNKFVGKVNFASQFDLVNGNYKVSLISLDSSASEPATWQLGELQVWFKEGQSEANNQRINKNYNLKREIIAQFPPANTKDKNPIIPFAFVAAIIFVFAGYMLAQQKLRANSKMMDFWGGALMLNIAVILYVISVFWHSVNLIDTLWRMLFLAPVTLFVFNKGLGGSANCDIPNKV